MLWQQVPSPLVVLIIVLLCCGRRTLIGRKAMRRRIAENAEMSGQSYFKEEAAENAIRLNDPVNVPQYAEFEASKPRSPDRLPLNPSQTPSWPTPARTHLIDQAIQCQQLTSLPGSYRIGLPSGPSPVWRGWISSCGTNATSLWPYSTRSSSL